MELIFSLDAEKELVAMDREMQHRFIKHLEKMHSRPPRKHMKFGIPCHVTHVIRQARIVFDIRGERIYILHCFTSHKEYEQWYTSYK